MPAEGFGEVAERLRRSTVEVSQASGRRRGSGSGVIWDASGLILTNAHVVRGERALVVLWDGRQFEATVTARDARRDLASLKIQAQGLPAATPADSSSLRPGELVLAVGNPFGFVGALTTGVVHAVGPLGGLGRRIWIQAAVRLAPGNSGGPLADARGRVAGLNTMVVSGGLALAIPSNTVAEFLRIGSSRASLGIAVRPVLWPGGGTIGLLILEVTPQGPAGLASLQIGDLLIGANGQPYHSAEDLGDAIESSSGVLSLQFLRGSRHARREVTVCLGSIRTAAA